MAVFVDPNTGKVYANVPDDEEERARNEFGLIPEADWQHQQAVKSADTKSALGNIGEGFQRGMGHIQDAARSAGWTPPMPGSEAFGPGAGMSLDQPEAPPVPAGAETFPEANSPEAKLRTEAHPVLQGIGTGLAVAPFAGIAGAAGGALIPAAAPLVGGAIGAIGGEQAVEAAAQEWDDAWLEGRTFQLKKAAGNLMMFSGLDWLTRGAFKVAGKGLGALASPTEAQSAIAGRNLVAEAQGAAAKANGHRPARSVGAASSAEMAEPYDDALATMTNRDATVLARDSEDYYQIAARSAADDMTRIQRGLSESLGTNLKYEDFRIGADAWTGAQREAQDDWIMSIAEQGQDIINQVRAARKGLPNAIDYGNLGAGVASDIDAYTKRLFNADDGAARNQLVDEFKKKLDRRMMDIDASYNVDATTRRELKDILRPMAGADGSLRKGLEDTNLFGHNAELQKALNQPWHDLLQHWRVVEDTLTEATGQKLFDTTGAGRNVRESKADLMLNVFRKDPRSGLDFGKHVAGAFDAYQRLIEARQAKGITHKEGLEVLDQALRNLMEDWNFAATVSVAKNRAANKLRNPNNWAGRALAAAEQAPVVGGALKAGRQVIEAFGDQHIQPGTALHGVVDQALGRYAKHPSLADTAINQSYSDWMQDALRKRGAPIPDRRGAFDTIKDVAKEHGNKVAGGALLAGSAAAGDENPEGAAGAGVVGLGMLLGKNGRRLFGREMSEDVAKSAEMMAGRAPSRKLWSSPADAAGMRTFADGLASKYMAGEGFDETAKRVAEDLAPEHTRALREWTGYGYKNTQSDVGSESATKLRAALDAAVGAGLTQPGEVTRGVWLTPEELETFRSAPAFVTPGFMATSANRHYARRFLANKEATGTAGKVPVVFQVHQETGVPLPFRPEESEILLRPGTAFDVKVVREEVKKGEYADVVHLFERPEAGAIAPTAATVAGGLLAVGSILAPREASAAEPERPSIPDAEPPPQTGPTALYRDAVRGIAEGGDAFIRAQASSALRRSPPKGRPPLRAFLRGRDIDRAVDDIRESLVGLQQDPSALVAELSGSVGDLSRTHPSVYVAMTEKAAQIVGYLAPQVPPRTGQTLLDPEGLPPSTDRSLDFVSKVVGAAMPRQAMGDIVRLDIPAVELAAFQQNWPELWEPLRLELVGQIQRRHEAGRPIDAERLRQMDALLGMNGQLDPSGSAAVAQHLLAAQEQAPAAPAGNSAPSQAPSPSGRASGMFKTRLAVSEMENTIG